MLPAPSSDHVWSNVPFAGGGRSRCFRPRFAPPCRAPLRPRGCRVAKNPLRHDRPGIFGFLVPNPCFVMTKQKFPSVGGIGSLRLWTLLLRPAWKPTPCRRVSLSIFEFVHVPRPRQGVMQFRRRSVLQRFRRIRKTTPGVSRQGHVHKLKNGQSSARPGTSGPSSGPSRLPQRLCSPLCAAVRPWPRRASPPGPLFLRACIPYVECPAA